MAICGFDKTHGPGRSCLDVHSVSHTCRSPALLRRLRLQGKRIDQGNSARREQSRARSLAAKQASLYTGSRVKLVSWPHNRINCAISYRVASRPSESTLWSLTMPSLGDSHSNSSSAASLNRSRL